MSEQNETPLSAHHVTSRFPWLAVGGVGAVVAWATYRLLTITSGGHPVLGVYLCGIALLVWQLASAAFDRPVQASRQHAAALAAARVAVLVPVYNEADDILRANLASLLRQTHLPAVVSVVDDGSTTGDYAVVHDWFVVAAESAGVAVRWERQANGGKRSAQVAAARTCRDVDFYVTVDSDTQLDARAIEESMQPFADPQVQSVAGTILLTNYDTNLLTRVQELWFHSMQKVDRAALSRFGAVLVNSGALATYRPDVLWDNVDDYLGETLFGRPVHSSDDSLLTLYAQQKGRTVHQSSAFAFTHMPTTFDGHRRQQLRWMRGSIMRSGTRFRELSPARFAFWYHLLKWLQYAVATSAVLVLAASGAMFHPAALLMCLLIVGAVQLVVSLPYLTLRRSDQSLGGRLAVAACAPLLAIWQLTFLRALRWYATATFGNVAWGTRAAVEVTS
ncbi:glycosyltransferase family 2 protein [Cellulomonas sp. JH27-2]|uniref:glycosyltransferase family 2 protein n=1 Tax=Cellulomonas sp. JH27-2 TaxID=2774139 RepID=UPI00177E2B70|nr:glycosyltransferase family 2 protein [Cellulomonas sp. JH27-2]MBD8058429.1 glycosyltransferase family 2 protein [Cellulomonas sp. JH27-2]